MAAQAARAQSTKGPHRTTARRARERAPSEVPVSPRFAPSMADQGALLAKQILEVFREDLEGLHLTPKRRRRAAPKQGT
jgi:hypothetical protein